MSVSSKSNVNQADIQATAIGLLHLGGLCMGVLITM